MNENITQNRVHNATTLKRILTFKDLVDGDIRNEMEEAVLNFGGFNSWHEGYGVLLEEVNELWDEIKTKNHDIEKIYHEAIQVAAMAREIALYAAPGVQL